MKLDIGMMMLITVSEKYKLYKNWKPQNAKYEKYLEVNRKG